jgi:hypothetical protein
MTRLGKIGRFALAAITLLTFLLWPSTTAAAQATAAAARCHGAQVATSAQAAATQDNTRATPRRAATVVGGGTAQLTYTGNDLPPGPLPVTFAIAGVVTASGAGEGVISFIFLGPAAHTWGNISSVDLMTLNGRVSAGSVAADGTVTLSGMLTETDRVFGEGVVFTELTTFSIQAGGSLGSNAFVLQWCALAPFQATVSPGSLRVR